jgi:pimeloyl-ACP methyl ester carboxylesterase
VEKGRAAVAEFILVHGGLAGAWCWELLEPELHRLGHVTRAMDLPIEEPGLGIEDYADAVIAATPGAGPDAWLVGHSMGGLIVPRVALKRPSGGIIFLCAGFPPTTPAQHEENYRARNPANESHFIHDGQGRIRLSFESAAIDFFHDCPPEMQRAAHARFRSQWTGAFADYAPIPRYPDIPMHAIMASEDAIVLREPYAALIRRRIGVEPVELPGSHCPFLSRPAQLAEAMHRMVAGEHAAGG